MRYRSKLVFAALVVTLSLSLAVAGSSARRFSFSASAFRVVFREIEWGFENGTVRCPLTLEGSFHSRTVSKVSGQLIGYITNAQAPETEPPCTGGTFQVLRETLPWHLRYQSFEGTLPNISGILVQIIGLSILYRTNGGQICLLRSTASAPARFRFNINSGQVASWTAVETTLIECLFFRAFYATTSGPMTQLGSATTIITVTLVQ
jgi:hypothetical protein